MTSYAAHMLLQLEIYSIVAISLSLVVGHAGILTVAQSAYFGVGAYTAAVLLARTDAPIGAALLAGGIAAAGLSPVISLLALRFRGDALIAGTLATQVGFEALFQNSAVTGGTSGLNVSGTVDQGPLAVIFGGIVLIAVGTSWAISHGVPRLSLNATRDDELAALSSGIRARLLRTQVITAAAALAGVAGAMFAMQARYIDPTNFSIDQSVTLLAMAVVGGTGNVRGSIIGAAIFLFLPEALRALDVTDTRFAGLRMLLFGVALVVLMRIRPQGLAGQYRIT